jgi:hypothetical protein
MYVESVGLYERADTRAPFEFNMMHWGRRLEAFVLHWHSTDLIQQPNC